jgi:hypothetical protein
MHVDIGPIAEVVPLSLKLYKSAQTILNPLRLGSQEIKQSHEVSKIEHTQ